MTITELLIHRGYWHTEDLKKRRVRKLEEIIARSILRAWAAFEVIKADITYAHPHMKVGIFFQVAMHYIATVTIRKQITGLIAGVSFLTGKKNEHAFAAAAPDFQTREQNLHLSGLMYENWKTGYCNGEWGEPTPTKMVANKGIPERTAIYIAVAGESIRKGDRIQIMNNVATKVKK